MPSSVNCVVQIKSRQMKSNQKNMSQLRNQKVLYKTQKRSTALDNLGRALVGSWTLSGEVSGNIRYEWAQDGLFLIQHVDIVVFGRAIKGIEFIGHLQRVGEDPSADLWSRFYSFGNGLTLDYVYELNGDRLRIWFMRKGGDNYFVGEFQPDHRSYAGAWKWPGGGYEVKASRVG